jgi:hypothetical protein
MLKMKLKTTYLFMPSNKLMQWTIFAGVINQNYLLAFYFDFYNNPGNKRVAPLTKVKNDTEGSITIQSFYLTRQITKTFLMGSENAEWR